MGEDGGDGEASWALDVHEEGSWSWNKVLIDKSVNDFFTDMQQHETAIWFLSYLQLVAARLSGWAWVEEINGENL